MTMHDLRPNTPWRTGEGCGCSPVIWPATNYLGFSCARVRARLETRPIKCRCHRAFRESPGMRLVRLRWSVEGISVHLTHRVENLETHRPPMPMPSASKRSHVGLTRGAGETGVRRRMRVNLRGLGCSLARLMGHTLCRCAQPGGPSATALDRCPPSTAPPREAATDSGRHAANGLSLSLKGWLLSLS